MFLLPLTHCFESRMQTGQYPFSPNFFVAIAKAFFGTLNPMFIFGLIFSVIIAYLVTALVLWIRETQVLDGHIADAEKAIREDVRTKGQSIVDQLSANVDSLSSEYSNLQNLIGK